jgi:hypothetical protein
MHFSPNLAAAPALPAGPILGIDESLAAKLAIGLNMKLAAAFG